MTAVLFLCAGAVGALLRLAAGVLVCTWQALLVVNVAGSAVLGAVLGADVSAATTTVLGVGFCGAVTTFSSFALEARSLGMRWGSAYVALTVACACAAASITMSL